MEKIVWFSLILIICIVGLFVGGYIVYSALTNGSLAKPGQNDFIFTYLGKGKSLKIKLVVIGTIMSACWLFILWGIFLGK